MENTRDNLRATVDRLGGEAQVCARLGVERKTITSCYDQRRFTAAWYGALVALAAERGVAPPPLALFGWKELRPAARPPAEKAEEKAA